MLLLRSERGIQSPSVLPPQPLPPLFTCGGLCLDQGLLALLHSQSKRWRPHQWLRLLFHSVIFPGQFLGVWPVTTTCSQVLAPLHAHLQFILFLTRLTRLGLVFHMGFFPVTAVVNVRVCSVQTSLFCPWEWPRLFREWLGFVGSIISPLHLYLQVQVWTEHVPDEVSPRPPCASKTLVAHMQAVNTPKPRFFFLMLGVPLFLNPSVPKVFSPSYRHFIEKTFDFLMFMWSFLSAFWDSFFFNK